MDPNVVELPKPPSNETVSTAALSYAEQRGWWVFPGKFAYNKVSGKWEKLSWKSKKYSRGRPWGITKDSAEIRRDFAKKGRTAIGVATGAISGIFVVEVDTKEGHDVDGGASLRQLEEQHGSLPDTLMAESPTGSVHRYYKHSDADQKIKCSDSKLGPGIDVKGDGGMVIAPPSWRPGKGAYRWLNELPIAEPPDWLLELVCNDDNGDAAKGEQQAPLWLVEAALAAIPNDASVDREQWINIGLAVQAATGGADAGFAMYDAWSRKWLDYDESDTRIAWQSFKPERIGAGTLFYLADQHDPNWRRRYQPGDDGPVALGFTRDGAYAFRDRARNLIVLASAGQLMAHQYLLGLMPSEFWIERYCEIKKKDNKIWFNPIAAGEALIAACKRAGPFNPLRVRGRGIWREGDDIIVNLGGPIPPTAKYRYVCFEPIEFERDAEFDGERLLRAFQLFPWRHPQDAVLLLGWAALAPICGVLSWRPHGFIYGPPQSGKTTLHQWLKYLLTPLVISTEGGSTEAGIRQMLGPDSQPVIIDEFENDQQGLQRILKLVRSASSADNPLLRGTPEGRVMQFSLCTTFLMCAVNCTGLSPADQSRILMLELTKHGGDKDIANQIKSEEIYFQTQGSRWCGHMVRLAGLMQPAVIAFQQQMPIADRHYQQNFATILAAAFVALRGRVPTCDEAAQWVLNYAPMMQRHADDNVRDNAGECLEHLKAHIVDRHPLGRWIATAFLADTDPDHLVDDAQRITQGYGIKAETEHGRRVVYIRNGAPNINAAFRYTPWAERAWTRALRTLDGAFTPDNPIRFSGDDKSRAIGLPGNYFGDEPISRWTAKEREALEEGRTPPGPEAPAYKHY